MFDELADDFADDDFADDFDDDETVELLPCPQCGAEVYEEAEQCPACGQYITHDTRPWAGRPWWWIALGVAGVLALFAFLLGCAPAGDAHGARKPTHQRAGFYAIVAFDATSRSPGGGC